MDGFLRDGVVDALLAFLLLGGQRLPRNVYIEI